MAQWQIDYIKKIYCVGDNVKLLYSMDTNKKNYGIEGTVVSINDNGDLLVCWNNEVHSIVSLMSNIIKRTRSINEEFFF